jgi:hypothetical protein
MPRRTLAVVAALLPATRIRLVDVPEGVLDEDVTVVGIRPRGPLELSHGAGEAVEAN